MNSVELLIGKGRCPLENPADLKNVQAPHLQIAGAGETLEAAGGFIKTNRERVIQEQRVNDKFLMNIDLVHRKGFERFQRCQIFYEGIHTG